VRSEAASITTAAYPAARAWATLGRWHNRPALVEGVKEGDKSAVYRLRGAGPDGATVIAKRCLRATAATERLVYERFLPLLPISSLAYYGAADDGEDPRFVWLFLEDAGDLPFSQAEHGALAARWLAALHTASASLQELPLLPERGPAHFLTRLRGARHMLLEKLAGGRATAEEAAVYESAARQCDLLEARWPEVEAACRSLPEVLVHGDFAELNLRVRPTPRGPSLCPLDWEKAGRAAPVVDLAKLDLEAYRTAASGHWRQLRSEELDRLSWHAGIFRALVHDWVRKPIDKIRKHQKRVSRAMAALGWGEVYDAHA